MIRAWRPEDRRFVVPTWARSWHRSPKRRDYESIDRILNEPSTRVLVLASDAASRTIHAWVAGTTDALHYVYVPMELRGNGVARDLITKLLGGYPDAIHITRAWPFESTRFHLLRTAA